MVAPVVGFEIGAWLLAIAWPIVKRVLLAMGIGVVTYGGLSLIATQVQNEIAALWSGLPITLLQIGSLAGIPQSIGITMSAIAASASLKAVGAIARVTS